MNFIFLFIYLFIFLYPTRNSGSVLKKREKDKKVSSVKIIRAV